MKRTIPSRLSTALALLILLFTSNVSGGILSGFLNFAATQTDTSPADKTAADAFPPDTSGAFPPDTSGAFPPDASDPFPPDTSGAFPPDTSGAFPPDTSGAFPVDASDPFPPDTSGAFPPDTSGAFPVDASDPFPPDTSGAFPPDTTRAFPFDASGTLPADAADNVDVLQTDTNNGPFPNDINNEPFPPDNNIGAFPNDNAVMPPNSQDPLPVDFFIPDNTGLPPLNPNVPSVIIDGPFHSNTDQIATSKNKNEAALKSETKVLQDRGTAFSDASGIGTSHAGGISINQNLNIGQGNGVVFNPIDQSKGENLPKTGVLFNPNFSFETNALGSKGDLPRETSIGTVAIKAKVIKSPEEKVGIKTAANIQDLPNQNIETTNIGINARPIVDTMPMTDSLPLERGTVSDFGTSIGTKDPNSQVDMGMPIDSNSQGDFGLLIGTMDPSSQGNFGMPLGQANTGSQVDLGVPLGGSLSGPEAQGGFGMPLGNADPQVFNPGRAQSFLNSLAGQFTSGINKPSKPKKNVPSAWTQLYPNGNRPTKVLQAATAEVALNVDPPLTDSDQQLAEVSNQSFGKHRGLYRRLREERIRNRKLRRDRIPGQLRGNGRANGQGRKASRRITSGNDRKVSISMRPVGAGGIHRRQKRQVQRCNRRLARRGLCQMEPRRVFRQRKGRIDGGGKLAQIGPFQGSQQISMPGGRMQKGGKRQTRQQRRLQGMVQDHAIPTSLHMPTNDDLITSEVVSKPGKMKMGGGKLKKAGKRGGFGTAAFHEPLPLNDGIPLARNDVMGIPMDDIATSDVGFKQGKMKKGRAGKGKKERKANKGGGKKGGLFQGKMVNENRMTDVTLGGGSLVETSAPQPPPPNTEMLVLAPGEAAVPVHKDNFETIPGLGTIVWDANY